MAATFRTEEAFSIIIISLLSYTYAPVLGTRNPKSPAEHAANGTAAGARRLGWVPRIILDIMLISQMDDTYAPYPRVPHTTTILSIEPPCGEAWYRSKASCVLVCAWQATPLYGALPVEPLTINSFISLSGKEV
ncbi:hypothetical protein B0H66DRAFT_317926 [Apodospora peruviana]|uniref:Uncharacterized protein n=1 Tax=Apodospora peruviana TaxID=516989 RepID=A0AAE0HY42_9PEZI|nr:hypothetical protein B0H66DRAFT_317926 [Apodospora peruviana]